MCFETNIYRIALELSLSIVHEVYIVHYVFNDST